MLSTQSEVELRAKSRPQAVVVPVRDPKTAQAILKVVSDEYSRRILFSAISEARTVEDLCRLNHVPMSTCYRRVHELVDCHAMIVDRVVITRDGKRYELYRSAIERVSIGLEEGDLSVGVTLNGAIAEELHARWISIER